MGKRMSGERGSEALPGEAGSMYCGTLCAAHDLGRAARHPFAANIETVDARTGACKGYRAGGEYVLQCSCGRDYLGRVTGDQFQPQAKVTVPMHISTHANQRLAVC